MSDDRSKQPQQGQRQPQSPQQPGQRQQPRPRQQGDPNPDQHDPKKRFEQDRKGQTGKDYGKDKKNKDKRAAE